jgi:ankyrin repeat protein
VAASSGRDEALFALLLEYGADATASRNDGWNSLMIAASKNRVEIMRLLLSALDVAAWVDARGHNGVTALIVASANGATAAVETLISAGADVHLASDIGITALHKAGNVGIARLLWNAGARDSFANDGTSTLMKACSDNRPYVVQFLLQCGLDVNEMHGGWTPLMLAASEGHRDILCVLLDADPLVDQQDDEGQTAMVFAAAGGEPYAVKILLAVKANPRIPDNRGLIPLMSCTSPESVEILVNAAPYILDHTCNKGRKSLAYLTPFDLLEELFASCARHNIKIDVNHADVNGDTALHMAMLMWLVDDEVELLLQKGADVFGVGYGGTTVLMKPFLHVDEDVIDDEYVDFQPSDDLIQDDELADSAISGCLRTILDFVRLLDIAAQSLHVLEKENGRSHMEREDHPSIKRQKL